MKKPIEKSLDEISKPEKVLILPIGTKAPYSGVLMDEDQFRYFKTQEFELEIVQNRVEVPISFTDYLWVFMGGVVIGIAGSSLGR